MTQAKPTTAAAWVSTPAQMGKELRRTQGPEARKQLVFAMQRYAAEQQHYVYL